MTSMTMRKMALPNPTSAHMARGVNLVWRRLRMRGWARAPVILARGATRERQRRRVNILFSLLG
jgi:hypothetical protein